MNNLLALQQSKYILFPRLIRLWELMMRRAPYAHSLGWGFS